MPVLSADKLRTLSVILFEKMKVPSKVALVVSDNIVENCLYGHDSHGMTLLPRFIRDIESGKIRPDAKPMIIRKSKATALINGNRGFGQVTLKEAVDTAVTMAKHTGISGVTVTNCNHVGILWTFARMIADKGMLGFIWCASGGQGGLVAPYGGIRRAIGANPIAFGIPAGKMNPLVLDISTSAVAGGKIILHAQQKKPIPIGWMLNGKGKPTTDPNELIKNGKIAGTLLPMAGYKGFGIGMVTEILGGILTGYGPAYIPDYKEGNGVFIMVIDIGKFLPLKEFRKQADALFKHVKSVPTDSKTKEILIPGEIEYRTKQQRKRNGIPVTDAVWSDIIRIAEKLHVEMKMKLKKN